MTEQDSRRQMNDIGLFEHVWAHCDSAWIESYRATEWVKINTDMWQYKCPMCNKKHITSLIWKAKKEQ
jgi:hypothetical protein